MSDDMLALRLAACISDLSRYKEAAIGKSDLKIGPHTIYSAMDEAERVMLDCLERLRKKS
jgi:hypothetical protein